jgi:hypothetical protein
MDPRRDWRGTQWNLFVTTRANLGSLGASAAFVGFVAGFGELIGYSLHSVSGYIADKSSKYWTVTFVGYLINMPNKPNKQLNTPFG